MLDAEDDIGGRSIPVIVTGLGMSLRLSANYLGNKLTILGTGNAVDMLTMGRLLGGFPPWPELPSQEVYMEVVHQLEDRITLAEAS